MKFFFGILIFGLAFVVAILSWVNNNPLGTGLQHAVAVVNLGKELYIVFELYAEAFRV